LGREAKKNQGRQVEVITTHLNADYDALASMLAAAKLYPEAMLVLPGATERNLRNFFVESTCYLFNFVKFKNVPLQRVKRLILVDTRQADRIGKLAVLLDDPQVEIHAYDHHPDSENDIEADMQIVETAGSTVAILSRLLKEKGVNLSQDEATLLALGIYEDTGSFTFASTTEKDYRAAAWLLGQGANLHLVSSLITRELTAEEVGVLNDLIHAARTYNINGVEVVVSEVSRESYVPEFAVLVHKFMDMEDLNALFALARMEGKLYLVARSRVPDVDAGLIASALGGGGHPTAASASLKDMTLVEAGNRLQGVLKTRIRPQSTAGQMMTGPVVWVPPDTNLEQAHNVLTRYALNVVPVVEDGKVLGIIGTDIVEKGLHHGLKDQSVSQYMETRVKSLEASATLAEVEKAIVGQGQRLVPVMENGVLAGVITRTDLLNVLIENPLIPKLHQEADADSAQRNKFVKGLMRERLPRNVMDILTEMGEVARDTDHKAYLVGGSVRDIFLRSPNLDLDVVVEGDAMNLARDYARTHKGVRVRTHKKFKTAKLIFPDELVVDVATARLEYYQAPAALPVVEYSSLKMDLYRRDFTINTMAVSLMPDDFGRLIDFFDGLRDIKGKTIRVLHNLSFVEDPTRVFRAVRFEQRFGFKIGKFTEGLIKNALNIEAFTNLSGSRLFAELKLMLEEDRPADCIRRLNELNLLSLFDPKLSLGKNTYNLLEEVEEALAWYRLSYLDQPIRQWLVYFLALVDPLGEKELRNVCSRLEMIPKLRQEILLMRGQALEVLNHLQRTQPTRASFIYQLLSPLRSAYQVFIMAKSGRDWVKRAVSQYFSTLAKVRPALSGDDLKFLGIEPGPVYKTILDRLLAARLDGEVRNRKQELDLVRAEFGALWGEARNGTNN
jgi:tRNA nucleotidyltransferase (CCA-adding enzyme)